MPGYKAHLLGGLATFVILLSVPLFVVSHTLMIDAKFMAWLAACALIGSLFPDIDIKSKGQFVFGRIASCFVLGAIVLKQWIMLSALSIALLLPMIVHHRSITHQVWFILVAPFSIPLVLAFANSKMLVPVFWGYVFFVGGALSHLILDFGPRTFVRRGLFGFEKKPRGKFRKKR